MTEQLSLTNPLANRHVPLAERMRPRTLDEVLGQPSLTEPSSPLRAALANGQLHSLILWGPPGTGKTTIALALSGSAEAHFEQLNAVTDGIAQLRQIIARAQQRRLEGQATLLFIDEIARWNKAQQDALLPYVEQGVVTLVGATTEHPAFTINAALLSRLRVYQLQALGDPELLSIAQRALTDVKRGVGVAIDDSERQPYELTAEAQELLLLSVNGDARQLLGALERAVALQPAGGALDVATIEQALGQRALRYDNGRDEHYATVSAFIKSIRGSDPSAALYWLARMEAGGEDPVFVARRLVIAASEEVGIADDGALAEAVSAMQAVRMVGPPECWLNLAHVTCSLALAPKSWQAYEGWQRARQLVNQRPHYDVPNALKNPTNALARQAGHGAGYIHPARGGLSRSYLPPEIADERIFESQP